jgi:hypothetical protein
MPRDLNSTEKQFTDLHYISIKSKLYSSSSSSSLFNDAFSASQTI